ncbi:glycosyl hydrolase family 43, partial [Pseudomonas sp. FW305-130]
ALDRIEWDDSVTPARIRPVVPTRSPQPTPAPTRNVAGSATAFASNAPVPVQYWIKALNDGMRREAPLPPDMWGTWRGADNPAHPWIEYRWAKPVTLNGS